MGGVYRTLSRLGLVRRWDQWMLSLITGWGPGWPRDRLIFVTGFGHSGTTLMQFKLHRQGVFTFFREAPDGSPELPREMSLSYLHHLERAARLADRHWFMTKRPSGTAHFVRRMGVDLRLLAPDCTVVVCRRDPAATALSFCKRHGWDPARARVYAANLERVLNGWRVIARRHRGPVHFVSLEDFSQRPEPFLRRILQLGDAPLPVPVETAGADDEDRPWKAIEEALPDPLEHRARRRVQIHLPVYPVDRDAWMETESGEVLDVLQEIRDRYGTSPSEFAAGGHCGATNKVRFGRQSG